jgi:sugar O-acyltransferase (sialic acid O-acetyltransferase NeuD family)
MSRLAIIGAGGLAREALAVVRETDALRPIGVFDDSPASLGSVFSELPVLGAIDDIESTTADLFLVCVGSGMARGRIVDRLRLRGVGTGRFATIVDPSVRNPSGSSIGEGSILLAHVSITADAVIGDHVVLMPGTTITHDNVVEDCATLAAGVALGGGVRVGRGAFLGMNSSVFPRTRVGAGATVGMGAVVLDDVPAGETWAGVPAHRTRITESLAQRSS